MSSYLVTGGAGFIGSNLVNYLRQSGHDVMALDDLSNGHVEFLVDPSTLVVDDFASNTTLQDIKNQEFDIVVHLAAIPRVSYSVEHPLETHDVNVTKTLAFIDACRGNISRFVFASSSSVYGGADILPTPETAPRNPQSPYALQKAVIEDYLRLYNHHYGLDSVALRFFNVFGPNQLGGSPYSIAISAWLTAILQGEQMRSDGDGSQSRDLCYVDNVVQAIELAAIASDTLDADTFNVACGDRTTNSEILDALKKRYPTAKSYDADWRPGDVMHTQADISKIERVLGYSEPIKFWTGLERTIEWYEKNAELVNKLSSLTRM